MSELRQDPTTGAFVIVAPERSRRPAGTSKPLGGVPVAPFDARCPFCPGNESQLPPILVEMPTEAPPGWGLRIVPNKFPAVGLKPSAASSDDEAHTVLAGYGFHEVIIESPRHDADLATMESEQLAAVVATYHQRFTELSRREGIKAVVLFRNHGTRSGASLVHPHAQIIALGLVPPKLRTMASWGAKQAEQTGTCATCAELERELSDGARIIEDCGSLVALAPYAAECPYETWLVPKRHQASFGESNAAELADMTALLGRALRRLKAVHGDPPYSFAIESGGPTEVGAPHLHWRLRIVPDLINWGGFERGAGMPINPSSPESDAAALRAALNKD